MRTPADKKRPDIRAGGPINQHVITSVRQDEIDSDTAHRGQGQCGDQPLIGEEIRRYEGDADACAGYRLKHGKLDLFNVFVGAGVNDARGWAGALRDWRQPDGALQVFIGDEGPVLGEGLGKL